MIRALHFKNFKALRDATLPLGQLTIIVGPNGSGKSTALNGLRAAREPSRFSHPELVNLAACDGNPAQAVEVELKIDWENSASAPTEFAWFPAGPLVTDTNDEGGGTATLVPSRTRFIHGMRVFALDPRAIARPVGLQREIQLAESGEGLAGVLDRLRDEHPERFESVNEVLPTWLPEFDRILFDTPTPGHRAIVLRTRQGGHRVPAEALSDGVLFALATLTLAYHPTHITLAAFEEPDRGFHPRMLERVREALYRLAYPRACGEVREPVQVVATTHNPYFLDLFKDHPEEIVLAEKDGLDARFRRLVDTPHLEEILEGAPLGEVWYTGVLGGVPAGA